ncbi:hypothetical protein AGLY_006743 [Aphis glycines]|uniref:Uncharacterized protein n=1 Tax=Aphis glycines TaxID=307491 RepID=A0A6G0TQ44_APHGL|nr:hypothetical protein AGLY_006743 [Aphis glycines]
MWENNLKMSRIDLKNSHVNKTDLWPGKHLLKSSEKKNAKCINFRALIITFKFINIDLLKNMNNTSTIQALLNFTNLLSFDFFLDGDIFVFKPLSSKLESDIISLFITQLLKLFIKLRRIKTKRKKRSLNVVLKIFLIDTKMKSEQSFLQVKKKTIGVAIVIPATPVRTPMSRNQGCNWGRFQGYGLPPPPKFLKVEIFNKMIVYTYMYLLKNWGKKCYEQRFKTLEKKISFHQNPSPTSVHVLTSGVFTFTKLYTMYGFLIFSIQLFQLSQSEEELKDTRMYFQTKKIHVEMKMKINNKLNLGLVIQYELMCSTTELNKNLHEYKLINSDTEVKFFSIKYLTQKYNYYGRIICLYFYNLTLKCFMFYCIYICFGKQSRYLYIKRVDKNVKILKFMIWKFLIIIPECIRMLNLLISLKIIFTIERENNLRR